LATARCSAVAAAKELSRLLAEELGDYAAKLEELKARTDELEAALMTADADAAQ
jgi:hypothetical protein